VTDDEILAGIREVVRRHLDPDAHVGPDTLLVEDLALDSLRLLTLVVEVEDRFRICLAEGDEAGVRTVADLVRLLRDRGA